MHTIYLYLHIKQKRNFYFDKQFYSLVLVCYLHFFLLHITSARGHWVEGSITTLVLTNGCFN